MSNKTKVCVECGKEHRRMGRFCRPCYNASRPARPCAIDDCERTAHPELAICEMHRTRKVRHGTFESSNYDPATAFPGWDPPEVRYEAAVDRESAAPCWLWTDTCTDVGYATFIADGKKVYVHRWVHEREIGPIPEGYYVDHVYARGCRHRNCVNPAHLEAVTPRENTIRGVSATADRKAQQHRHGQPWRDETTEEPTT